MENELGLKGALKRNKGCSIRYGLKNLWWEIRYAWQRAWRGYDFTDVFELAFNFSRKLPILLRDFKKNNPALFTDRETGQTLSEEETNAVLDELIFYFENCDEESVYQRLYGVDPYCGGEDYDKEKWDATLLELNRCEKEALRLFSKWIWCLWY